MDTITHGLLGATVAQLGFRQRIGRDATWAAVVATIVPDLDILVAPLLTLTGTELDEFSVISNHRGISHSLLMIPVLSLVVTTLWWWFRRRNMDNQTTGPVNKDKPPPFWLLFLAVFLPMLTHPFLDWCTTYGTQLLAPFTNRRFGIDAIAIVDIIYTPVLILTLLACFVVRKVKSDPRRLTLVIGWTGFGISMAYITSGLAMREWALSRMRAAVALNTLSDLEQAKFNAYPQLGTIFLWRGTVQTPEHWQAGKINLMHRVPASDIKLNSVAVDDNEWVRRARELPQVKVFDWFTMGQTRAVYSHRNGDQIVDFYDMRYGIRPESLESIWSVRATYDKLANMWTVEYVHAHRGHALREMAGQVWRDIWTP